MATFHQYAFWIKSDVLAWLGSHTVSKARDYVDHVQELSWNDKGALLAQVPGSNAKPYNVHITFVHKNSSEFYPVGACSCPVGYNCKHVAATLLACINNPVVSNTAHGALGAQLTGWLSGFSSQAEGVKKPKGTAAKKTPTQTIVYALVKNERQGVHTYRAEVYRAHIDRSGQIKPNGLSVLHNIDKTLLKPPLYATDQDLDILRLFWSQRTRHEQGGVELSEEPGHNILQKMQATGRLYCLDSVEQTSVSQAPLQLGAQREGRVHWGVKFGDLISPTLQTEPAATYAFLVDPFWYLDRAGNVVGPVGLPYPSARLRHYFTMPPITLEQADDLAHVLSNVAPELPKPPTRSAGGIIPLDVPPVPVLVLSSHRNEYPLRLFSTFLPDTEQQTHIEVACLHVEYGEHRFELNSQQQIVASKSGQLFDVQRHEKLEKKYKKQLEQAGLQEIKTNAFMSSIPRGALRFNTDENWLEFMNHILPTLRADGWRVDMSEGFRFNIIDVDDIYGDLHQGDAGWFDLHMGIRVGDRNERLEPLLANLFKHDARWLNGELEQIPDTDWVELRTDQNERLRLRAGRLKPVVRVLIDLFDGMKTGGGEALRISQFDVGRLEALDNTARWEFHGDASIANMVERLKNTAGVSQVELPNSLNAVLRPYQHQGVSWMQFLREHGLSGVLADDMGLGKTIQTLTHILIEKEAGRLDRPVLVILPTSLVHNWCDEAHRFAPSLRVLTLHGAQRMALLDQIPESDLIITTYGLLWRDQALLAQHPYHMLILDEAQVVKNATTKAASAIRDLQARHRLCLTGTPLENHLGELWALFDFLLPGFLGAQKQFTKLWRTPIEKNGDAVRRDLLARRIRPFMLRRKKDDVATELPPKTMILRTVDIEGAQRDLYETVRSAMHEKVRNAISENGLARSQIVVLDALLKLRQVCCDPRLLKLTSATKVKESAKMALLMSMLPDLIEEGRRVLLFSQFTGMLDLIAAEVEKAKIPYVMLTGKTKNRAQVVQEFQEGQSPLFLISLKAGGVGLNLTAADTVIHYDPWWNPAAENQATDRAHRMGQDKPVFVYKLIVAGSIEEKIVALQEKKAALVDGILSEDSHAMSKFAAEDLDALFQPIE